MLWPLGSGRDQAGYACEFLIDIPVIAVTPSSVRQAIIIHYNYPSLLPMRNTIVKSGEFFVRVTLVRSANQNIFISRGPDVFLIFAIICCCIGSSDYLLAGHIVQNLLYYPAIFQPAKARISLRYFRYAGHSRVLP